MLQSPNLRRSVNVYLVCTRARSRWSRRALTSETVRIGVQGVIDRRLQSHEDYQYDIRLPGL